MTEKKTGIYHKFNVQRTDGTGQPGGKHDGCTYFVLDVTHDKYAAVALLAYARACRDERPELATDLQLTFAKNRHGPQSITRPSPSGSPSSPCSVTSGHECEEPPC